MMAGTSMTMNSSNTNTTRKRKRSASMSVSTWEGRKILCTIGGYVVVPHARSRGRFEPGRLIQVKQSATMSTAVTQSTGNSNSSNNSSSSSSSSNNTDSTQGEVDPYNICVVMSVINRGKSAHVAPLIGDGSEGLSIVHRSDDRNAWHLMPLSVGTAVDDSFANLGQ